MRERKKTASHLSARGQTRDLWQCKNAQMGQSALGNPTSNTNFSVKVVLFMLRRSEKLLSYLKSHPFEEEILCCFIHKHQLNLDLVCFLFQTRISSTEPLDIQPLGLDFYGQRHWRQGHQSMFMCPQFVKIPVTRLLCFGLKCGCNL